MKKTQLRRRYFYMFAIIICFLECLSYYLYSYANDYIYYLTAFLIVLDILLIRKIRKEGMALLIITVLYFVVDNLLLTGTFILGSKYAVIFLAFFLFERVPFEKSLWRLGFYVGALYFLRYMIGAQAYLEEFNRQTVQFDGIKHVQMLNVNIPCFMLFICYIFVLMYCKTYSSKYEKPISLLGLILNIGLSYVFDCRITILTSLMLWVLVEFVPVTIWNNKRRATWLITGIMIAGCLYPFIYILYFYKNRSIASQLLFSGREVIWANYVNLVLGNPRRLLLGLGHTYRIQVSNGLSLHNSFLEMAFNFGFVGVFLYGLAVIRVVRKAFDKGMNKTKLYLIPVILTMMTFAFANTAIQREYLFVFYSLFIGLLNNTTVKGAKCELTPRTHGEGKHKRFGAGGGKQKVKTLTPGMT